MLHRILTTSSDNHWNTKTHSQNNNWQKQKKPKNCLYYNVNIVILLLLLLPFIKILTIDNNLRNKNPFFCNRSMKNSNTYILWVQQLLHSLYTLLISKKFYCELWLNKTASVYKRVTKLLMKHLKFFRYNKRHTQQVQFPFILWSL